MTRALARISSALFLASLAVGGLEGCQLRLRRDTHNAPGKYQEGVSAQCNNGYAIADGPYRYENNQWGSGKAQGPFEQCLLKRTVNGKTQRGWTWNFPGTDPTVFSYPEIIFGWKPWTGGKTTHPALPTRVGDFAKLTLVYEVESQITGSYNLAPEVWIVNRRVAKGEASPKSITAEVMFWVDSGGIAQPGGSLVGSPVVNGETYELWVQNGANGSGASEASWRLISFKWPKPQLAGSIDIPAFLRVLVDEKLIDPQHYIATVEFGNEVTGGTGTTWVKHFEVQTQ
jgi:Glycosyl hydrolase family 12